MGKTADYTWTLVTREAAYAPRDGAGAVVFKDRMWLLGGWRQLDPDHFPRDCNNEVWSSKDGLTWVLEKPNTYGEKGLDSDRDWEGRHTAGYAVHDDRIWILAGDAIQGHYQNDVWNSADGTNWTQVIGNVPWGNRALHYTVVLDGRIWVMGGQKLPQFIKRGPTDEMFYNDVWNTTDGVEWTRVLEHAPWAPRGMIGGSAVFQDRIWILGGGTYDTPACPQRNFFNDVWSSPDGVQWECHVQHAPWTPRQYHEVAVFDDKLWVLEGYDRDNRNDVWYSADGIEWHEVPNTPWNIRHAASVFVYDNALWMVAGNNMEKDVWKLTTGHTS